MEIAVDNGIIERLRIEKALAKTDCKEEGCLAGRDWASVASYKELQYAAEVFNPIPSGHGCYHPRLIVDDDILGDYFREAFTESSLGLPKDGDDCLSDLADAWVDGWFEGVNAVWREVCTKL